jgi:hypothetical protein
MAWWKLAGDGRDILTGTAVVLSTMPMGGIDSCQDRKEASCKAWGAHSRCALDTHLRNSLEVDEKRTSDAHLRATESKLGYDGVGLAERTDVGHRLGMEPDLLTWIIRSQICGTYQ